MNDNETGTQHSTFAGRVKAAREAQNLTRDELAARLGLTRKHSPDGSQARLALDPTRLKCLRPF